jgi:hypothetical protein
MYGMESIPTIGMNCGELFMAFKITEETSYTDPHSRGTGSIVTERKGYILRTRGEHNRLVRHDYRCPIHGVFEVMVRSGDVPESMPCPAEILTRVFTCTWICCMNSEYVTPTVAQGWSAGKVKT